jgi:hypothetical protein
MLTGSGGVLFGLYKYIGLLKHERTENNETELKIAGQLLDTAIKENIELANSQEELHRKKKENKLLYVKSADFCTSEPVGLGTLVCLRMLSRNGNKTDLNVIADIVKQSFRATADFLNGKTRGIIKGTSGYLHALLLLENQVKITFTGEHAEKAFTVLCLL